MAETTLHIGGRQYVLTCRDGEEAHLAHLAGMIEARADAARSNAPGMTEVRTLLFAALFLADELNEFSRKASDRQAQLALQGDDELAAKALEALAKRIETLTQRLAAPLSAS